MLALLFMAVTSWADPQTFIGTWQGKGTYIRAGDLTACATAEFKFSATDKQFVFESGGRTCEKHSEQFYRVAMDYRDGLLYFYGQVVGRYDGNILEAYYREPDGETFRNWRMSMRREGDHLVYEESRTMDGETTPLISFAGLLIKQN